MSNTNQDPTQPENNDISYIAVSPDQSSMFTDPVTANLEIGHEETASPAAENSVYQVSKAKILASLAIVAAAGYIAYWVQEPVQIQADVLAVNETNSETAENTATTAEDNADLATSILEAAANSNSTQKTVEVEMSSFGFEPAVLTIEQGTTVKWTNTSNETQTIVGALSDGSSFTSSALAEGESFEYEFTDIVTAEYYSTYSPALKAIITVGEAAVSTTETENTVVDDAATTDGTDLITATDNPGRIVNASEGETSMNISDLTTDADTDLTETLKPAAADNTNAEMEAVAETEEMTDEEKATAVIDDLALKGAAESGKDGMTKTGPEDAIYLLALGVIAFLNRKKLSAFLVK